MAKKTKKEEVTATITPETSETSETPVVPNITAGDLSTMVKVIDAGSQRGAWRGEELTTIGGLREKLVTVINAIAPKAEEDAPKTEEDAPKAEEVSSEVEATEEESDAA